MEKELKEKVSSFMNDLKRMAFLIVPTEAITDFIFEKGLEKDCMKFFVLNSDKYLEVKKETEEETEEEEVKE